MMTHTLCDEDRARLFADLAAQHDRAGRALFALDWMLTAAENGPVDEWTVAYFRKVYAELLDPTTSLVQASEFVRTAGAA